MRLILYLLALQVFLTLQGVNDNHLEYDTVNTYQPTLLGVNYEDNFEYWKVIKKSSIKYDEVDIRYRISVKSSKIPQYSRILYNRDCKSEHSLPSFYKSKKTDTIVANHITFPSMYKFIDEKVIEEAKEYNSNSSLPSSEKVERKKGWDFLKFNRDKVCLIKLKMSIGYYNKNTHSMKLIGDYDDEITLYYITW